MRRTSLFFSYSVFSPVPYLDISASFKRGNTFTIVSGKAHRLLHLSPTTLLAPQPVTPHHTRPAEQVRHQHQHHQPPPTQPLRSFSTHALTTHRAPSPPRPCCTPHPQATAWPWAPPRWPPWGPHCAPPTWPYPWPWAECTAYGRRPRRRKPRRSSSATCCTHCNPQPVHQYVASLDGPPRSKLTAPAQLPYPLRILRMGR